MKMKIAVVVVYLVAGVIGMGLFVVGQHLWQDHLNLHALVQLEAQRQQAAKPAPQAQ